ncbi:hypothetical protein EDD86DRAFT_211586 [Gorgonomyces haynaldii]|nr:hypothetical protein EDD86DRAFT_211586 [Gorgonomyces haynaldii]
MTQLQRDASTSPTKSQTLKEIGTNTQLLQDTARALDSVKMSDASLSPIKQLQSTNTTTLRKPEMVDAGTTKKPEMTDASVSSHPPETIDVGISAQMRMTDIGISAQTRMRDANNSPIRSLARVNEDPEQDLGQTHESVEFDQLQELRKIAQLAQSEMIQLQRKIGEQQLRIQKLQNRSLKDKIIDLTQELSQLEPQEQRMILKPILGEPKDDRMRNEVKRRNLILSKLNQIFDQKLGLKNLKTIQSFEQLQEELLIKASKIPTILHVNMLLDSQKMLFSNKIQQLDDRMSMVQQKMAHLKASQEPKDYRITKLETELQLTREQHHKDQQIYKQRLTHVLEEKRKMEQDLELCLNKLSQIGIRPKSPKTKKIPEVQLKRTLNVQDYARALAEGERLRMLLDKEHEQQKRIIERVQDLLNQHQQQPNLMAALEHLKQELMSGFD